jgi:hypothetical protein
VVDETASSPSFVARTKHSPIPFSTPENTIANLTVLDCLPCSPKSLHLFVVDTHNGELPLNIRVSWPPIHYAQVQLLALFEAGSSKQREHDTSMSRGVGPFYCRLAPANPQRDGMLLVEACATPLRQATRGDRPEPSRAGWLLMPFNPLGWAVLHKHHHHLQISSHHHSNITCAPLPPISHTSQVLNCELSG